MTPPSPPGCRVTPECYGHMTRLLSTLAGGRVVVALEGGYNLSSISYCMAMCTKARLPGTGYIFGCLKESRNRIVSDQ